MKELLEKELVEVRKAIENIRIQFERLVGAEQLLLGLISKYDEDSQLQEKE